MSKSAIEAIEDLRRKRQIFIVTAKMKVYAEGDLSHAPKILAEPVNRLDEPLGGTVETFTEGTKTRKRPTRIRTKETKKEKGIPALYFPKNSKGVKHIPKFGGPYGILHRAFATVGKIIEAHKYNMNALGLIQYTLEDGSVDMQLDDAKITPEQTVTTISLGRFGKQMPMPTIRDSAEFETKLRFVKSANAPITEEEFYGLLEAVEIHGFGPTGKGYFKVMDVDP